MPVDREILVRLFARLPQKLGKVGYLFRFEGLK
jgi:hypothetical protein